MKPPVILDAMMPDWAVETLWQPARHIALKGGRGAAKTRSIGRALLLQAAVGHHRVLCARETQNSIRDSSKRLLDDEIGRLGLGHIFTSTDTEIRGPFDSLFVFSGLRNSARSIKSLEGITDAWPDEAQAISKASIETLVPTIRAPGSRLIWSWNPDLPTDPVDAMFCGPAGPPPNSIVRHINFDSNPWFPEELRAGMEWDRARDPEKYAHIWLGEYRRNSEARVFRNWRIEAFETPDNARFYFGADWGFSVDPSVLIRCWVDGRTLYVDHEAYAVGCEIDHTPALFAGTDTQHPPRWTNPGGKYPGVPGSQAWVIRADSARPETISYMKRAGFRVVPATKGPGSVEEGVNFLKNYDIVVHPRCQHTIDELTLYSWKTDPLTGDVLPVLEDKKNHVIDALRYGTEGIRSGAGRVDAAGAAPRQTVPEVRPQDGGGTAISGWGGVAMPRASFG